jgi:hypothetical protein
MKIIETPDQVTISLEPNEAGEVRQVVVAKADTGLSITATEVDGDREITHAHNPAGYGCDAY